MKSSLDNLYEMSLLADFYGALLSQRQQDVLRLYHEENCSLQEIAEELGISRQGVHEALKKAEKSLRDYEAKLGLVVRVWSQAQVLHSEREPAKAPLADCGDPKVRQGLLALKNDIDSIEEQV